jgi:hypothetical protein
VRPVTFLPRRTLAGQSIRRVLSGLGAVAVDDRRLSVTGLGMEFGPSWRGGWSFCGLGNSLYLTSRPRRRLIVGPSLFTPPVDFLSPGCGPSAAPLWVSYRHGGEMRINFAPRSHDGLHDMAAARMRNCALPREARRQPAVNGHHRCPSNHQLSSNMPKGSMG